LIAITPSGGFTRLAQGSERRHLIRRAVGKRHRCQLRLLSGGQTELDPPAEEQVAGDAMAAANLRHGHARLSLSCTIACFCSSVKWGRFYRPSARRKLDAGEFGESKFRCPRFQRPSHART
jgi:hypothetical protein